MKVDINKVNGVSTPASTMTEYITDHIVAMMIVGGIEAISISRESSGFASVLNVETKSFSGAPREIVVQGVVIKDSLAQLMLLINVNKLTTHPDELEEEKMRKSWDTSVSNAKSGNSSQAKTEPGK